MVSPLCLRLESCVIDYSARSSHQDLKRSRFGHYFSHLNFEKAHLDPSPHSLATFKVHIHDCSGTMNKLSVSRVVLALATLSSTNAACPCLYTDDDAEDCIVYGKIDGDLVPWMKASQECLDIYKIKSSAPDPALICASSNGFVNSLRSGLLSSSQVKFGLGVSQGGFWVESGTNNLPVIKDSITINGITTACTPETVQVDCYTAMKPYFEGDADGKKEMADVCETLKVGMRNALEFDQSVLRLRLCIEDSQGSNIRQQCDGIWTEVSQKIEENPDRGCQFVSFGPGTTALPGCEEGVGSKEVESEDSASSQVGTFAILVVCLSLILTNMVVL
jgi:hypothetical protein